MNLCVPKRNTQNNDIMTQENAEEKNDRASERSKNNGKWKQI